MEEKHIRWGELVGGLMIVASSIALVVSFWWAIAERPILKFGVLNGVTAALFGMGLYAARRWKLPTTSQGILLTSTLLVPLNFLAIAAFSRDSEQLMLPVLAGEGLSTILLGTLVFLAVRIITPAWPVAVTAGVVLPAIGQLIVRRHVDETSTTGLLYAFALAGLAVYLGSQIPVLWSRRGREPLSEEQGNEVFKQLGLVTFSLVVMLGLLLAKAQGPAERLQWLSPLSILLVCACDGQRTAAVETTRCRRTGAADCRDRDCRRGGGDRRGRRRAGLASTGRADRLLRSEFPGADAAGLVVRD